MLEAFFTLGLMVALPIVYFQGKRAGFERHHCIKITDFQDRAPQTFVTVACPVCRQPVDCALDVRRSFTGGVPTVNATVDATDLEHHTLTHIDELNHPAG
jgi:hypothetical protein